MLFFFTIIKHWKKRKASVKIQAEFTTGHGKKQQTQSHLLHVYDSEVQTKCSQMLSIKHTPSSKSSLQSLSKKEKRKNFMGFLPTLIFTTKGLINWLLTPNRLQASHLCTALQRNLPLPPIATGVRPDDLYKANLYKIVQKLYFSVTIFEIESLKHESNQLVA